MRRNLIPLLVALALGGSSVYAQEKSASPRFGLTFPSLGVIWHITDNVAFVPNVTLARNWSTYSSTQSELKTTTNSVGVTAGLRFYTNNWKGMRFYLSPSYGFSRNGSDTSQSGSTGLSGSGTTRSHSVGGAWGVQYAVTDRISFFGDIGARYSHSTLESSDQPSAGSSNGNFVSTVGTWGLIVYLK